MYDEYILKMKNSLTNYLLFNYIYFGFIKDFMGKANEYIIFSVYVLIVQR